MSQKIMSTRGTNGRQKAAGVFSGGALIVASIFLFAFAAFASKHGQSSSFTPLFLMGVIALIWGIAEMALYFYWSTAYLDVYDDHMEGKGIQQIEVKNFYVKNSQIKNITVSGMRLQIHSDAGEFKIITSKKTASKIYEYFRSIQS